MKLDSNVWVPDCDPDDLLQRKCGMVGDLPAYQYEHILACVDACRPDRLRVAIDGGAHVGLWSLHLLRYFDTVLAFEPIKSNFECLIRNAGDNPKFIGMDEALSNKGGTVSMISRGDHSFQFNVSPNGLEVPCCMIDSFNFPIVDLIKLDVEGHEFEVLQGAARTLQRCKPVVIIEEKLDPDKRATNFLRQIGMRCTWSKKHDYLFNWESKNV